MDKFLVKIRMRKILAKGEGSLFVEGGVDEARGKVLELSV